MALSFDKIKDLIGVNGTIGVDLLGSARVRDDLFVSGYLTVGGNKFNGLNINGVKAIDKDVKWKGTEIEISKGGTGTTTDTTWNNEKITTNADGTLNYDGKTAIDPSIESIAGTLTVDKGGTGATANTTWLNSKITTKTDGTLNYDGTGALAPSLASIPGTVAKAQGGFGADASTVSVALIADNLEASGLKAGRTLGDGLESQVIFHDYGVAGTASGDAVAASTIWKEGDAADTYVIKVVFNYQHQTESVAMKFVANLRISGTSTATAKLEVYAMNSGGTSAASSTGGVLASATATHNAATYAMAKSGVADISGLSNGNIYRCEISLKNDRAAGDFSFMTGLVVTTAGA